MQKVKLLTHTNYKGRSLKPDDVIVVDDDVAKRWSKRNIATVTDEGDDNAVPFLGKEGTLTAEKTETPKTPETPEVKPAASEYEGMKPKDLFELCKKREIDVEAKKDADYYIEKLVAADAK